MKPVRSWLSVAAVVALAAAPVAVVGGTATQAATSATTHVTKYSATKPGATKPGATKPGATKPGATKHMAINCSYASAMCTEVGNSDDVFGYYVGHDEPSMLFYSNKPGAGNHMRYGLTLPTNPSASHPTKVGKSYAFELSGAEWLGMAMCDSLNRPGESGDSTLIEPTLHH